MNGKNMDENHLRDMLRRLPEREPPAGLAERIMTAVEAPPKSLGRRIGGLLAAAFPLQPLRGAVLAGAVMLAFWLGMTVGGSRNDSGPEAESGGGHLTGPVRNPEADFFIGRGLLVAGQWKEAAEFLRAARLATDDPEHALWEAVALGKQGDKEQEREIYRLTVNRYPDYVPARLYLGHNLLESGDAAAALEEYSRVLALMPDEETALYNRALAGRILGDRDLEAAAWKEYLRLNRTGKWAYRAVTHLNALGDFTYRGYRIGHRLVIGNQDLLLGPDSEARRLEADFLASAFAGASGDVLNLVVFLAGDAAQAEGMARELQYLFGAGLDDRAGKQIDISWFGEPETVRTASGVEHVLTEGLMIFCTPRMQQTEGDMI
ncbi:MAG TPA: hypothetical protein ENN06_11370 [Desulfobacteraceae bacterium]|nr:hypothetical protein [Desulfobacteraceae bacterium]